MSEFSTADAPVTDTAALPTDEADGDKGVSNGVAKCVKDRLGDRALSDEATDPPLALWGRPRCGDLGLFGGGMLLLLSSELVGEMESDASGGGGLMAR